MIFISILLFSSIIHFIMSAGSYDSAQLNTCVWLSGAAYCGKDKYSSMILSGPASGFIYKNTLYDVKTDLQGYIGIIPNMESIYVVLRGSSSTLNWLDDFEINLINYDTYPECGCQVHNGFYRSALGVKNITIDAVKLLKKTYPLYSVVVTGHSYGASVGQLLSMELERVGIEVRLYNYGQPRVGDQKYANFTNTVIHEYWRTTHNKDIVPHVPPSEVFGYFHSCREIFETSTGELKICSEVNCEDPTCADQYILTKTNSEDHETYLTHRVSCEASTI